MQKAIGSQVRDGRLKLGLTQREFALRCEVEFGAVFAVELYNLVSPEDLSRMCQALKAGGVEILASEDMGGPPPDKIPGCSVG